ncbi:MAG TPA: DUF1206 domain-containing protein [Jatrophihabitans sp.]|jgi:hypothetical protein
MTSAADSVRGVARSDPAKGLARLGFAARATIYLLIGIFALLLALGKHSPEADQRGAMQELARHTGGYVLLLVIAIGLACYALWRWSEAAFGVVGEGKKTGPRLQSLARGCIYAFFAVNAFNLLAHSHDQSQASQQQLFTTRVMRHPSGRIAVGIAGVVVVIVGLTGIFLVQAAVQYDPKKARGLDGALRTVADSGQGRVLVGIAALGLIAFGLYGYAEAIWRRT